MNQKITILDGGMGRELEKMGAPFRQPEWSALALIEAPEFVRRAHDNFIEAGAEVITTNAYAVVPFHIGEERFAAKGRSLIKRAAMLARDAANEAPHPVQVAGCIPPVFGSYRPGDFETQNAPEFLLPLIEEQEPHVDFWLAETISSVEEATTVLTQLEKHSDKPVWLALTLTDRKDDDAPCTIRSGRDLADAIETILSKHKLQALLFNCNQPEEMEEALQIAAAITKGDIPLGAYANAMPKVTAGHNANLDICPLRGELTPASYLKFAQSWHAAGASILGGCCGIGPDHIRKLAEEWG